jgi:hypothetical protein
MNTESKIKLEDVLKNYFYKEVEITFNANYTPRGYLIGIKLPIKEMIMLYFIQSKNIEKYLRHKSRRWVEQLPLESMQEIQEGS